MRLGFFYSFQQSKKTKTNLSFKLWIVWYVYTLIWVVLNRVMSSKLCCTSPLKALFPQRCRTFFFFKCTHTVQRCKLQMAAAQRRSRPTWPQYTAVARHDSSTQSHAQQKTAVSLSVDLPAHQWHKFKVHIFLIKISFFFFLFFCRNNPQTKTKHTWHLNICMGQTMWYSQVQVCSFGMAPNSFDICIWRLLLNIWSKSPLIWVKLNIQPG